MFTEQNYENAIIALFQEDLGYDYLYGPEVERDHHCPLYKERLAESLERINPDLPQEALNEAVWQLQNYESRNLIHQNIKFTKYLQQGIEVNYVCDGKKESTLVKLIDNNNINNNDFLLVNQWTVVEQEERRPDLIVFLNGLPVVVVELKSCSRENTDVSAAFRQLRNYTHDIPSLFIYNMFMVISDLSLTKAGTLTATEEWFMEWKTVNGDYEDTRHAAYDTLFKGMFEKRRFLDLLQNFILYSRAIDEETKILAGYHQYVAVRKAVKSTRDAVQGNGRDKGKAGVVWHTTGSGKSLSMVFYARLLQEVLENPTVVVLTDRNDLDDQLHSQFEKCTDFLRQSPERAESRADLKKLLEGRIDNGIFFTTMQKFEQYDAPLSDRSDIILISDEAHRSQYSLDEKIDAKTGRVKLGFARLVRESMSNATFIGFTGTPIAQKDRNTLETFGDCIDIYDMTQSVEDGATRPVYYENRVINLGLNEQVFNEIDQAYDRMSDNAEQDNIEKSKKQLARMESILGAEQTLQSLCEDIVQHYEQRQDLLTGKAMIVACSRPIAVKILHEILRLRPEWHEKIRLVMTSDNNDPEDWKKLVGTKEHRKELARKFKSNEDEMKIAIVVDMWLTGFDVPSLATMYVYKPMAGHNLMQAIARVNRVYKDKEGGLVVDYVGIASALKQAMNDYTVRDREKYGDPDISKEAYPKFQEKIEVCRNLFHGLDYSLFFHGEDKDRAHIIVEGINFILGDENNKTHFIKEAMLLKQSHSLCRSLLSKEERFESAFFESVRMAISRLNPGKKLSLSEINSQINELLKHSIKSDGIINLFADAREEVSLFDSAFLKEIATVKQKNLAAELLAKLLKEQIQIYRRTNLVQSTVFSERMKQLMNQYHNGHISNAIVIEELMNMAFEMQAGHKTGEDLGLTTEEKAFYDAITKPEAVKDFYDNETLVQLTHELTEMLNKSKTIDWQKKETARAEMRSMVKRLLKKYGYPPEGLEGATELVIQQCEMWVDHEEM